MPSESAARALEHLRDPSRFDWTAVPLLVLVVYVYSVEVERRSWSVLLAGLAFWGMDWFNEIWNALIFRFTGYAPLWAAPGETSYLILIGLNVEICLMFAAMGIVAAKSLPADRSLRILGLPNRWVLAVAFSLACVLVELALNAIGALTWDYAGWSARSPLPIFLIGYLPFFAVAFWVHDMGSLRSKLRAVGTIFGVDAAAVVVFGAALGWI